MNGRSDLVRRGLLAVGIAVLLVLAVSLAVWGMPAGQLSEPPAEEAPLTPPRLPAVPQPSGELAPASFHEIYVAETYNRVYGTVGARAAVSMQLLDPAKQEKGHDLVDADGKGFFQGAFYAGGIKGSGAQPVDIRAGDEVLITTGAETFRAVVPPMTTTLDIPTDRVLGTALPYTQVFVTVQGQQLTLTSNFAGAYSVSFAGRVDILPADMARVIFAAGDLWMEKNAFAPGPKVRPQDDEVLGYDAPGLIVEGALYSAAGELKGLASATTNLTDGGYILIFGEGTPADIIPGDRVVVTATQVVTAPVLALDASVNLATDTVSGHAPAGRRVRVVVSHPGPAGVEWYVRHATADTAGSFRITFGDIVDLQAGDELWVAVGDNFSTTEIYVRPRHVLVDQYYDRVEGAADPGEELRVALLDAAGALLEERTVLAHETTGSFEAYFDHDIMPGQRVRVAGQAVTTTIDVLDFTAQVEIDADRLLIHGPPSARLYGWYSTQQAESVYLNFQTDAAGNAEIPLTGYDLRDGDDGSLYYTDANGNINYFKFRQPALAANTRQGRVLSWFDRNSDATFSLYDGSGALKESASVRANSAGFADWWPTSGLRDGDLVVIECCRGRRAELRLTPLSARADTTQNLLTGQAPASSVVLAEIVRRDPFTSGETLYQKSAQTDAGGAYRVPFDDIVRIRAGDRFRVWWQNADGDWMLVDHYAAQITVNQTESAVYGVGLDYSAPVTITLHGPDGTLKATKTALADRYSYLPWTVLPAQVLFGDRVRLSDGRQTIEIPVDALSVDIDPLGDRLTTHGLPNAELSIWVEHPPELGNWDKRAGQSDAAGIFTMDYAGSLDLQPGDRVLVEQSNPAGHRVGILQSALRLAVHQTYNNVELWTEPGRLVTMTLRSAAGAVKEVKTVAASPANGRVFRAEGRFGADIWPGDVLEADNGRLAIQVPIAPIHALLDIPGNRVAGIVPPARPVRLDFHIGPATYTVYGWSDDAGAFVVGPGAGRTLSAGDSADVWYIDEQGQRVGVWTFAVTQVLFPLIQP